MNQKFKIRNFTHFVSPMSWFFQIAAMCMAIPIIFKPTLYEFFIACVVVDSLAFLVILKLIAVAFDKTYPESVKFFYGIDHNWFAKLSADDRVRLIEDMMRFPKRYAKFCYFTSFIKATPTYLVIIFYWKHDISNLMQFSLTLGGSVICYFYFYGVTFFGAHQKISRWIEELHSKFNLTREFELVQIPEKPDSTQFQEIFVQIFIVIFVLVLQGVIVFAQQYTGPMDLAFKLSVIGIMGLMLFTRIWYMGRQVLMKGLVHIFSQMNKVEYNHQISLALNASPLLANFQKNFNRLTMRIALSERKLRSMVFHESEKSRYQTLGEISGLIAHNLSAPLHVIQYCTDELAEDPSPQRKDQLVEQIRLNSNRAVELITSLRARLKNSSETEGVSEYKETHDYILRLLEIQFGQKIIKKIQFSIDPFVARTKLAVPRVELMQVLDNLYRNSVRNFLENKIETPKISISIGQLSEEDIEIIICDNGSGLTSREFQEMTDDIPPLTADLNQNIHRSLGLRLTRRLVEMWGGTLTLQNCTQSSAEINGTKFSLRLKRFHGDKQKPDAPPASDEAKQLDE